jgi:CheY-like chemotaxis protein
MHALVIEDDAVTAMLIEVELRDLGFAAVDLAATEEEAISAVARHCPDLVTSDGSLMAGSGIGAVRKIRASVAVPVVFITGDPERARHCIPTAPNLEKPFTVAQLAAAVELVCNLPAEVR